MKHPTRPPKSLGSEKLRDGVLVRSRVALFALAFLATHATACSGELNGGAEPGGDGNADTAAGSTTTGNGDGSMASSSGDGSGSTTTGTTSTDTTGTTNDDGTTTSSSGASDTSDPSQVTRVARLTHDQYQNTIEDLLGISDGPAGSFAPDALNGFEFDTSINFRVDARLGPQYRSAAEQLAERTVTDDEVFNSIVTCNVGDGGCGAEFIVAFGQRAFRRPLTPDEQGRFQSMFDQGAALVGSGDAFRDGVRMVVEAMLQSPQFLYRSELSDEVGAEGLVALDDWEVASRLSYFVWGTMPDDDLFGRASRGELSSAEQVANAAAGMLADPRALRQMVLFHRQAWDFSRFSTITPDAVTYPNAPDDIVERVNAAASLFVEEVINAGGGLSDLLTAPYGFADSGLAPLYGADVDGDFTRIDFDPNERKGYLMQVGFLASHAYSIKTDPIHRGLFVVRDLLCRTIPDPPAGASTTPPPETSEPIETTREEISLLTGQPDCAGCHAQINPAGFAFEGFDALGQVRTMENGVSVDTSASMTLDGATVDFAGATELVDALANSAEARSCYASKWLEYAYGRNLTGADAAATEQLGAQPRTIPDIVARVAETTAFLMRPVNEVGP